jgi:hypothetical protein
VIVFRQVLTRVGILFIAIIVSVVIGNEAWYHPRIPIRPDLAIGYAGTVWFLAGVIGTSVAAVLTCLSAGHFKADDR